MNVLALLASGVAVIASAPAVLGHGYIVDPAATWKDGYAVNGWGSSIDNNMFGEIDYTTYGYGTDGTVAFFEDKFEDSGYDSLGQFIDTNQVMYSDDIDFECGYTVYDEDSRSTMPSDNLTYTGFTHPGPCEVWCDDNKVLFDYDCQTAYPEGTMPYDESLCADANRFTIYWIGLHGAPWQVFTDCVWLENGGSSSGSAPSPVTEEVDSSVVTAPPTASGSGSTLTATTAYPSTDSSTTADDTAASTADEASTSTATTTASSATTDAASTADEASSSSTTDATSTADEASSSTTTTTTTTTTAPTSTTATPTATTATPTATTATPATTTATPTATASTSTATTEDKCSVRRHRRD